MKGYVKHLEFKQWINFGNTYLNVKFKRLGEYNNITFINPPIKVFNERNVRHYLNN